MRIFPSLEDIGQQLSRFPQFIITFFFSSENQSFLELSYIEKMKAQEQVKERENDNKIFFKNKVT